MLFNNWTNGFGLENACSLLCSSYLSCALKSLTNNNCTDAKTRVGLNLVEQSCNNNSTALSAKGSVFPRDPKWFASKPAHGWKFTKGLVLFPPLASTSSEPLKRLCGKQRGCVPNPETGVMVNFIVQKKHPVNSLLLSSHSLVQYSKVYCDLLKPYHVRCRVMSFRFH